MFKRTGTVAAVTAVAGLVLAGCSSSTDDADTAATGASAPESSSEPITMAIFNGWDDSLASTLLWQHVLTQQGYDVELEYADPAPVYQGVADGDFDIVTDVWLPATHEAYIDEFGDQMEELGTWFDSAANTIAVNADAPIDSLADLAEHADEFGNRIVGIEPGAGLTGLTEDAVIPGYGLEGMDFQTSSTPAMLSALDKALADGENIVVTLWEPHWAYGAYDIKNLEDPEGALGSGEEIFNYGRAGFSDDYPKVAEWMTDFSMESELLYDLENALKDAEQSDYQDVVADWAAANQEWIDSITA